MNMKRLVPVGLGLLLFTLGCADSSGLITETKERNAMTTTPSNAVTVPITQPHVERRRLSPDDVRQVAPALERYTQERLYGEVWKRADLSPRDRSIVTVAALVAR